MAPPRVWVKDADARLIAPRIRAGAEARDHRPRRDHPPQVQPECEMRIDPQARPESTSGTDPRDPPASTTSLDEDRRRSSRGHEPSTTPELLRHYLRDLVYGANDGIITTFAVVAGVAGAALPVRTVLVLGMANLLADGFSMGASNFLGIRSDEAVRRSRGEPVGEPFPLRHGAATMLAFVVAGSVPLVPFVLASPERRLAVATAGALAALFLVGALRSTVTLLRWWKAGMEMLLVGALAAAVAYGVGFLLAGTG
jgi:hypothetical protein